MFAAYLFHVNMMLIKIVQDVNVLYYKELIVDVLMLQRK